MKKILIYVVFFMVSMELNADTLGLRLNAGIWNPTISGFIKDSGFDSVDIKNDLFLEDNSQSFIYLSFEHPVPLFPNVRIGKTSLNTSGTGVLNNSFEYDNTVFTQGDSATTTANLDHTEITAYWSILDNYINLDLGFNIKAFDGEIKISTTPVTATTNFDDKVPLFYVAGAVELPLTGLSIGVEASLFSAIKASLTDISTYIRYETPFFVGAELGFRTLEFESSVASIDTKFTAKGTYLSAFLHF